MLYNNAFEQRSKRGMVAYNKPKWGNNMQQNFYEDFQNAIRRVFTGFTGGVYSMIIVKWDGGGGSMKKRVLYKCKKHEKSYIVINLLLFL